MKPKPEDDEEVEFDIGNFNPFPTPGYISEVISNLSILSDRLAEYEGHVLKSASGLDYSKVPYSVSRSWERTYHVWQTLYNSFRTLVLPESVVMPEDVARALGSVFMAQAAAPQQEEEDTSEEEPEVKSKKKVH